MNHSVFHSIRDGVDDHVFPVFHCNVFISQMRFYLSVILTALILEVDHSSAGDTSNTLSRSQYSKRAYFVLLAIGVYMRLLTLCFLSF